MTFIKFKKTHKTNSSKLQQQLQTHQYNTICPGWKRKDASSQLTELC